MSGKKRASPGLDTEKDPLESAELSDEHAQKLQDIQKQMERAELILERRGYDTMQAIYKNRREIAKAIPKFWPIALMNHPLIGFQAQHKIDRIALSYLEDLWVERDVKEPRCFTIEFYFKSNPYFTDSVLKKEYKYVPPPGAADEQPDKDGLTPSMLAFVWTRDAKPSANKIDWKNPENALTKLHPRVEEDDDDDDKPAEAGSFFNFFELSADPFDIGTAIANEVFVEATNYFLGNVPSDDIDSEEEDEDEEDDDDDDAEEIDLEKHKPKKQRVN